MFGKGVGEGDADEGGEGGRGYGKASAGADSRSAHKPKKESSVSVVIVSFVAVPPRSPEKKVRIHGTKTVKNTGGAGTHTPTGHKGHTGTLRFLATKFSQSISFAVSPARAHHTFVSRDGSALNRSAASTQQVNNRQVLRTTD